MSCSAELELALAHINCDVKESDSKDFVFNICITG